MKADNRSCISKHHILYVEKQFQRNPKSVRLPLPVSVFCYRITDTSFGFLHHSDRETARGELVKFADSRGYNLSFTTYRDVNGPIAAQVILWHRDNTVVRGVMSIHHGGVIKDHRQGTIRNMVSGKLI